MAESNDSLLQFDNILLDVNENLSNTVNHLFTNTDEHFESTPPRIECDVTFNETLKSLESSNNCIQMPENCAEILFDKVDTRSQIMDENYASNRDSDSGIHDSENNVVENSKLIDFAAVDLNLSGNCGVMISDFNNEENDIQVKDEEFHDAVQFFKDPSSLMFLENAGASCAQAEPLIARSSLYMNFDPLHAKFYSQPCTKSNELQEIEEDETEPEMSSDNLQSDTVPDIVNNHIVNVSPRQSLGNILISFDSPIIKDLAVQSVENEKLTEPQKLYTEEELQQALKIQELSVQETFLKRQHDLEITRSQKQQELEVKIEEQKCLSNSLHSLLKEVFDVVLLLSDKEKVLREKLEIAEKDNDKLKEDLKTSVEDLQSVESTFSDFHKRYEQCKSMLKVYTQNEDNLKQQLENMKVQLNEKEEMYKVLQFRTQEMLDKANTEVANAKKAGDAQVAVLKAQLKKAELKVSSLESDVKHVKIENSKLSSICDELMAKVSEA